MQAWVLLSHNLFEEQEAELKAMGASIFRYPDGNLQKAWSNVPPDSDSLDDYSEPFKAWLATAEDGDLVVIQGDFGLTLTLVAFCLQLNLKPLYATSHRHHIEYRERDGAHISKIFRHERFRNYKL